MLAIIILVIPIALILSAILVPIVAMQNKKKIKEMESKIDAFEKMTFSSAEEKEEQKRKLKKELIKIKATIVSDKLSIEHARDLLEAF